MQNLHVIHGIKLAQYFEDTNVEFFEGSLAEVFKAIKVNICLTVVLVSLEKVDSLLDLGQDFFKLRWFFDCLVMIKNVCALFLVFVVLLMFLNFTDNACKYVFSI